MNIKLKIAAIACSALLVGAAETYTVKIPGLTLTNCVSVVKHTTECVDVRYVKDGVTNDFHAWLVPVVVVTNTPDRKGQR